MNDAKQSAEVGMRNADLGADHAAKTARRNIQSTIPTPHMPLSTSNSAIAAPRSELRTPHSEDTHLSAINLKKIYRKGQLEIPVLTGVNLEVQSEEFLAIVGQSGSGKSTLLHLLGTLDAPTSGEVHFAGHRIDNLPSRTARSAAERANRNDFSVLSFAP